MRNYNTANSVVLHHKPHFVSVESLQQDVSSEESYFLSTT